MGPKSKAAIERRLAADSRFQKYCMEELRLQRGVQNNILDELKRLSGLLEESLGVVHHDLDGLREDIGAVQRLAKEHERYLKTRPGA